MCHTFLPGYRAGGPIRSISNLLEELSGDFAFKVVTRERDLAGDAPYPGIEPDRWSRRGAIDVLYLSPPKLGTRRMIREIGGIEFDLIYLNSFFSFRFSILPLVMLRLGLIPSKPVVLAPRGEFSPGALGIRGWKKRLFIFLASLIRLHRRITWHATSPDEIDDIRRVFGQGATVVGAPNLVRPIRPEPKRARREKQPGTLTIAFLSRISPKKNLDFALKTLRGVGAAVTLDICGPVCDRGYWRKCRKIIASLPENIKVLYHGELPYPETREFLSRRDIFYLPTRGENFGHAVWEALSAGCPALVSDLTPWRGLEEKGAGWDLPLARPDLFEAVLRRAAAMNDTELEEWSRRAGDFAREFETDGRTAEKSRQLFLGALIQ